MISARVLYLWVLRLAEWGGAGNFHAISAPKLCLEEEMHDFFLYLTLICCFWAHVHPQPSFTMGCLFQMKHLCFFFFLVLILDQRQWLFELWHSADISAVKAFARCCLFDKCWPTGITSFDWFPAPDCPGPAGTEVSSLWTLFSF